MVYNPPTLSRRAPRRMARPPAKPPRHVPPTPPAPVPGRRGDLEEFQDLLEDRLEEMAEVFDGDVMDAERWEMVQQLLLPERYKAPPPDPAPVPRLFAASPEARVLVMEARAREGLALHAPHDPPMPEGEDGTRGLKPGG